MDDFTIFAADNFFISDKNNNPYFNINITDDILIEESDSGYTELSLTVEGESLWIKDFDTHKKCEFFSQKREMGLKKSSDHIVFQFKRNEWFLHIIEFKTTINSNVWIEVKRKFRASYFNSKAIATVLGIDIPDDHIYVYTTYEKEHIGSNTTNPVELRPILGKPVEKPMSDWNKGELISFRLPQEGKVFRHTKIQMKRSEKGLIGELVI